MRSGLKSSKTTLRQCLILGVITKDALVPLADAEAALDEFERSLIVTIRAKEAQLAEMTASQAKIAQVQTTAKSSAETLARGGAGCQ